MIHLSTVRWASRVALATMVMASHAPGAAGDGVVEGRLEAHGAHRKHHQIGRLG